VEEDDEFGKIAAHSGGYPGFGTHMRWHTESGITVVALQNGRYAAPVKPAIPALRLLLGGKVENNLEITNELISAKSTAMKLIKKWDENLADAFFAVNMDRDFPRPIRKRMISEELDKCGVLLEEFQIIQSNNASHIKWVQSGSDMDLEIEIWLAPLKPIQAQVLKVSAVNFFNSTLDES
jgi:hypothetical protein